MVAGEWATDVLDKLENAFHKAVVLGDPERREYVDALRLEDPLLADKLQRLLDADGKSNAAIEVPVVKAIIRLNEKSADR